MIPVSTAITALIAGAITAHKALKHYWDGHELLQNHNHKQSYNHSKRASMWAITGMVLLWGSLATASWPIGLFPLLAIILLGITYWAAK